MITGLYAGSFDPITYGHIDIIEKAAFQCDLLYVAIAINPLKKTMFTEVQRKTMIKNALSFNKRLSDKVNIIEIHGPVAEYAYINGIDYLFRGIRNSADREAETPMAEYNMEYFGIPTKYITASSSLEKVSSSAVKQLASLRLDISNYVPLQVKHALEYMYGYNLTGVVGNTGSGKSTMIKMLCERLDKTSYIDMDSLGHEIYASEDAYAINVREEIVKTFDLSHDPKFFFDRKHLGAKIFGNKEKLIQLNEIMRKPMRTLIWKKIRECDAMNILIDAAVLVENNSLGIVNKNVIHVTVPKDVSISRIMQRDNISEKYANDRYNSQMSPDLRNIVIQNEIDRKGYGNILEISGMTPDISSEKKKELYDFVTNFKF